MVKKVQGLDKLRQPKGVFAESTLRIQKENGWGWLSKITAIFKSLGRAKVDNQVGEEIVRDGREIPAKKSNRVTKPAGVRSNNKSKTSGEGSGKTVRSAAQKSKSKGKAV